MTTIEKVYEPSRIRRGRASTAPSWYVAAPSGRWRFGRKMDAQRFVNAGSVCQTHREGVFACPECLGRLVGPAQG